MLQMRLKRSMDTPQVYIAIVDDVDCLVNPKTEIGWEGEDGGTISGLTMGAFQAQVFANSLLTHCWLRRFIAAEAADRNYV